MVSEEQHRIPHIRELAVAGDFALIGGFSAHFLGRLFTGYPGGVERLLARSGIPTERCDDVLRAVAALVHVGTTWRLQQEACSGSGTSMDERADRHLPSNGHDVVLPEPENHPASTAAGRASPFLGTSEAAAALGVSTRLVRRLASTGALREQREPRHRHTRDAAGIGAAR
jgi:hypothetical protein